MPHTALLDTVSHMPSFAQYELELDKQYSQSLSITGNVNFIFRRTAWRPMLGIEETIHRSEFFCWVLYEGERVGAIAIVLYRLAFFVQDQYFIDVMDDESAHAHELATELCTAWKNVALKLAVWGPIAEVQGAWLDKRVASRISIKAIVRALERRVVTNYSVVVLKAFPLQSGSRDIVDPNHPAFKRRTAALMRHYSKAFGVVAFPASQDGWMWRANPRGEAAWIIHPPVAWGASASSSLVGAA